MRYPSIYFKSRCCLHTCEVPAANCSLMNRLRPFSRMAVNTQTTKGKGNTNKLLINCVWEHLLFVTYYIERLCQHSQ